MSVVYIPASLRRLTGGVDRVEVHGATVAEIVRALDRRFPGVRAELVVDDELAPHVAVSVDGVVGPAGLSESVGDDSEIHFIPPLGGG